MKTFADKLKEHRMMMGLTQEDLASLVGVQRRAIQSYEMGDKKPRPATLRRLAEIFNVHIRDLTDDEDDAYLADMYDIQHEPPSGTEFDDLNPSDRSVNEVTKFLEDNPALFAGGSMNSKESSTFLTAVLHAFMLSGGETERRLKVGEELRSRVRELQKSSVPADGDDETDETPDDSGDADIFYYQETDAGSGEEGDADGSEDGSSDCPDEDSSGSPADENLPEEGGGGESGPEPDAEDPGAEGVTGS